MVFPEWLNTTYRPTQQKRPGYSPAWEPNTPFNLMQAGSLAIDLVQLPSIACGPIQPESLDRDLTQLQSSL